MTPNDRGYGLGRAAGEFLVAIATKEMRAQRLPEAHQPPKAHRRVLAAGFCQHKNQLFTILPNASRSCGLSSNPILATA